MRVLVIVFILLVSLAAVFVETAVMAVWGDMDFKKGELRPWPRAVNATWPERPDAVQYCESKMISGEWYSGSRSEDAPDSGTSYDLVEVRVGWPFRTFTYERTLESSGLGSILLLFDEPDSDWIGGLKVPAWLLSWGSSPSGSFASEDRIRRIPLRPLWGGIVVVAGMHAVPIGAAWFGVAWAARWRRRRRERCERCGYDVRGLAVCPECARPKGGG